MVKAGMTMSAVARKVKQPLFTVVNILKKYKTSGSVANKDRSGRPQKATPCDPILNAEGHQGEQEFFYKATSQKNGAKHLKDT